MLLSDDIAFLQGVDAKWITLAASIPAILFSVYVIWDDRRQARLAAGHGGHDHDAPKVSPPLSHGEPGASAGAAKPH